MFYDPNKNSVFFEDVFFQIKIMDLTFSGTSVALTYSHLRSPYGRHVAIIEARNQDGL